MSLPDLPALLALLVGANVEFVVVGGIAVGLHGYVRATADLDIVPDPDPANLVRRGRNVSLTTRHGDVDVIRTLPGVPTTRRSSPAQPATRWTD